jgi:hypothetical protein
MQIASENNTNLAKVEDAIIFIQFRAFGDAETTSALAA